MEPIKPVNEITQDTIKERTADGGFLLNDEAAVKLVVDDTNRCDAWMNLNQWASGWTQSAIIYQSPAQASAFEGTSTARANVPKYTVSNHISAIIPKIVGGMFYDDPPSSYALVLGRSRTLYGQRKPYFLFNSTIWSLRKR